jgi:hypothetical protein
MNPRRLLCFAVALAAVLVAIVVIWPRPRPPAASSGGPRARLPAATSDFPQDSAAKKSRPDDSLAARIEAALSALLRASVRGEARPDEAVLAFADDPALRRFLAHAAGARFAVTGQIPALRALRVRFEDPADLEPALRSAGVDPESLGANFLVTLPHPPAREARLPVDQVPFGNGALAFLGAAGDRSTWGRGTTIAVLDTGVAPDATFGQGRLRSLDLGHGTSPGRAESDGHGTAVAALAAGAALDAPGVAPAANLLSIRVTDATSTSDLFTLARAIVAAVDSGARIINVSLGGYTTGPVLDGALAYAAQHGALLVAAAGNDQAARLTWPAADSRVVSVGAVDRAEQQVSFSNSSPQLQLSAPGYGVHSAWLDGQRVTLDGTSASAPFVAGAIAAVMSQSPGLTPAQAAALLARTANDTGPPGADSAFGHGIVNLGTALNAANPAYVDTAVASHHYDPTTGQMQFVVQNRSGRALGGLSLEVLAGQAASTVPIPSLAAGATFVAAVPVRPEVLRTAGSLTFTTRLVNPPGTPDARPENNTRTSILAAPERP